MPKPCRRHPLTNVLPRYLLCPQDALDVLEAVEALHPDARQVALVVDRDRRGVLSMPIIGGPDERHIAIDPLVDVLVQALKGNPDGPMGIVLCSVRPGQTIDETPADVETWRRIQGRCQDAGIELLDWFLSDDSYSRSMAETCDEGWPDPPGLVES